MRQYKNFSLKEFCSAVSSKTPVPGGGSSAALAAAVAVSLLSMAAKYSKGKSASKKTEKKIADLIREFEKIRKRLLDIVDLDAKAYSKVTNSRKASPRVKKAALKEAGEYPLEVCRLCYSAICLAPVLVKKGNSNLMSDVRVAVELLYASYNASLITFKVNQITG